MSAFLIASLSLIRILFLSLSLFLSLFLSLLLPTPLPLFLPRPLSAVAPRRNLPMLSGPPCRLRRDRPLLRHRHVDRRQQVSLNRRGPLRRATLCLRAPRLCRRPRRSCRRRLVPLESPRWRRPLP